MDRLVGTDEATQSEKRAAEADRPEGLARNVAVIKIGDCLLGYKAVQRRMEQLEKTFELLVSRRLLPGDCIRQPSSFLDEPAADRLVDRCPRREEPVDVGTAHPEARCDICDRCLLVTDAAKMLFRHIEDTLAPHFDFSARAALWDHDTWHGRPYSAASAIGRA